MVSRWLGKVPEWLSSPAHIMFLIALGVWLIVIPLIPGTEAIRPSAFAELVGGNWTNVSSAVGACVAAGASLKAHHVAKKIHTHVTESKNNDGQP